MLGESFEILPLWCVQELTIEKMLIPKLTCVRRDVRKTPNRLSHNDLSLTTLFNDNHQPLIEPPLHSINNFVFQGVVVKSLHIDVIRVMCMPNDI